MSENQPHEPQNPRRKGWGPAQLKEIIEMERDPVCGMYVNEASVADKTEYNGKTYYFCKRGCKTEFDKQPAQYTRAKAPRPQKRSCCG